MTTFSAQSCGTGEQHRSRSIALEAFGAPGDVFQVTDMVVVTGGGSSEILVVVHSKWH